MKASLPFKITISILLMVLMSLLIYLGYDQKWTGFQEYINSKGEVVPAKNLWDWLQLLIVPIFLAAGAWWLNKSQKNSEQQIESDRQRQKALEDYFACMTDLLLSKKLRNSKNNQEVRSIARIRTLALMRILDGGRKGQAIQFLYESGLISKNPIIQLRGADLNNAKLSGATLRGAELRGVYFVNADFTEAHLIDADLRGSDFTLADMSNASLINANLRQATVNRSKLRKSDLTGANLTMVDTSTADMTGAILPACKGGKNG